MSTAKPKRFDANLIVIGAGSAGLISALIAATVRAKVTLIERSRMGGDCLNTGCVPSKTLIRSAKIAHYLADAQRYGLRDVSGSVNFSINGYSLDDVVITRQYGRTTLNFKGSNDSLVSDLAPPRQALISMLTLSAKFSRADPLPP